jgi:hypothetical protein
LECATCRRFGSHVNRSTLRSNAYEMLGQVQRFG